MKPAPLKNSAVGLLAVLGCVACEVPEFKPLEIGDPAPGFAATTLDGAPVTGDDLLGAPYMLNIWATWCAPCRKEMPELQELHDAYAGQGFRVVGVSVDDKGSADLIGEFTEELQIGFPIFHDPSWEIVDAYFLLGLPGTFLVDAEGMVVRRWMGPFQPMEDDVQRDVRALLGAAEPAQP